MTDEPAEPRDDVGRRDLVVREMRRGDVHQVVQIERARHPLDAWTSTMFHEALDAADRTIARVVEIDRDEDDVLAYGVVSVAGDTADLDNITVREDVAARGIGRWFLRELLRAAASRGAREVLLEVQPDNTAAVALYRSEGFVEISRRRDYYAPGVDALVLRRAVDPDASAATDRSRVVRPSPGSDGG